MSSGAFPRASHVLAVLDRMHGESVVRTWSRRREAVLLAVKLAKPKGDGFLTPSTFPVSHLVRGRRIAEISNTRVAACQ